MNFDKDKVEVKAGSTAEVTGTLNIHNSVSKQRFVEGFISLKAEDSNIPSLSVPFMGYYGDWAKENNIDIPNYKDSSDSILGISGLVTKTSRGYAYCVNEVYNGQIVINKDKVVFLQMVIIVMILLYQKFIS